MITDFEKLNNRELKEKLQIINSRLASALNSGRSFEDQVIDTLLFYRDELNRLLTEDTKKSYNINNNPKPKISSDL